MSKRTASEALEGDDVHVDSKAKAKAAKFGEIHTNNPTDSNDETKPEGSNDSKSTKKPETQELNIPGPSRIIIKDAIGNIFSAPNSSILIHACNCQGVWGTGIAAAFRRTYPRAFLKYKSHCKKFRHGALSGTTLIIPPLEKDGPKHHIACLFTSHHYGRKKDKPDKILTNTKSALNDMYRQIAKLPKDKTVASAHMCQINSGAFDVPWERTFDVVRRLEVGEGVPQELTIWSQS